MHCFGYTLVMSTICAKLDPGAYMGCIRLPFLDRMLQKWYQSSDDYRTLAQLVMVEF
jgi:hypothetical protein